MIARLLRLLSRLLPARLFPAPGDVWGDDWTRLRVVSVDARTVVIHDGHTVVSWTRESFESAAGRWTLIHRA